MLKVVEYFYVYLIIWTILLKKLSETIGKIIALSKLKNRFMNLFAKPYNCFSDEFRCPLTWSYKPRSYVSGEQAS